LYLGISTSSSAKCSLTPRPPSWLLFYSNTQSFPPLLHQSLQQPLQSSKPMRYIIKFNVLPTCGYLDLHIKCALHIQCWRRLEVSPDHLDFLRSFPSHFRFIVLQHSEDKYASMWCGQATPSWYCGKQCLLTLQIPALCSIPHSTSTSSTSSKERTASAWHW